MIGRGLMFHSTEYFAIWPTRKVDSSGPGKTLSSRALNTVDGRKLGSFPVRRNASVSDAHIRFHAGHP